MRIEGFQPLPQDEEHPDERDAHQPAAPAHDRRHDGAQLRAETQRNYIRDVKTFAAFLGRSPDTATPEDLRRFQLHLTESGVRPPTINSAVSALRFFFTVTLDRPDVTDH